MIRKKHMSIRVALVALLGAMSLPAYAQDAQDAHAGHHPTDAPVTEPPPAPSSDKPSGMMDGPAGMGGRQGMMKGMMQGSDVPMHCMAGAGMPMSGDIDGRITALRAELKITGAQSRAWNAFADVLRANAKRLGQMHAPMMMGSKGAAPPSMAQRLDLWSQWFAASLENVRALKPALTKLYAGLSAEQRTDADRLLAPAIGLMPAMPMGGMAGE